MAGTLQVIDGRTVIRAGESTIAALSAAARAEASEAAAAIHATFAESVSGPTYASTAAGLTATSDGEGFAVDNGDGTVTVYLNDTGSAVAQRTLATTAALGSTSPGAGAALVGVEGGGTTQDAIEIIGAVPGTRAQCAARSFPSWVQRLTTTGYATAGDGGRGNYVRVGSEPSHAGKFQDTSGQWWELDEDIVYIEQFGAVADANPDALTGSETDNADAINNALAYGTLVRCRQSLPTAAFGFKSQIQIGKKSNVLGNLISPNGMCLVPLPDYAVAVALTAEPVIVIQDERGSIDGIRLVIPDALWDSMTSTGNQEVYGVATTASKYKARIHNCDVIGGSIAFQAAGLEGDFYNCRGKWAEVGMDVTGYDNEFSNCCEMVENDIGFRSVAGGEGSMHCVRNRVNFQLTGSVPYKIFLYDDTPYEYGLHAINLRHTVINIAQINVGQNRVDPASEPARHFLLEDSYNNRFTSHGVSVGSGSTTNLVFIEINDSGGAAAAGIASVRNVFEGFRLATIDVGADDTQRALIARNRFERCSGPIIGRYNANGGELIGEGVALSAGGTRNFTVYLPRNPGTQANTTITVEGRLIMRSGTNKRCVKDVIVSLTNNASGETLNEAKLTERYKSTGNTDTYNETITGISYSAVPNSFTFTFTGPSAVSCTCEFVWDRFLVNQGAF